jgi:SNW domain-containing protein 1
MDTLRKEQELRQAAKEAREKKMNMVVSNISSVNTHKTEESELLLGNKRNITQEELEQAKIERNNLRNQRKKEIERDRRIEISGNKKAKLTRDVDRDISEKIALGQAQPSSKETMIDSRLYNQTTGLESGFKDEDDFDLYSKPLFSDKTSNSIYNNIRANNTIDDESEDKNDSKKL